MFKETSFIRTMFLFLKTIKLLLCSAKVNLIESLDGDQRGANQQQNEPMVYEDIYMARQGATCETRLNNLGYQHISDSSMTETLQGAERLLSEIFHDDFFCIAGPSISLDSGNDPDNSSTNSGSVMHTVQKTTLVLLGLLQCILSLNKEMRMVSLMEFKCLKRSCTDKEPKDLKIKDMNEDVESVALNFYLLY